MIKLKYFTVHNPVICDLKTENIFKYENCWVIVSDLLIIYTVFSKDVYGPVPNI